MDIQEWKKLSSAEKSRVWDTLSEAEKAVIRSNRRKHRSHRHSGSHGGAYRGGLGIGYLSDGLFPLVMRILGVVALLAGVIILFAAPELFDGRGVLSPSFLTLLLVCVTCVGFASVREQLAYAIDKLRSADTRIALVEERLRKGALPQSAQKASSAEDTSDSEDSGISA